jgi:predicted XRE-type DNA-binding protein
MASDDEGSVDFGAVVREQADSAGVETALANFEGRKNLSKIRYSHDAMIDLIIQNPSISQNQLAEIFGYTASWVSIVMNSDMFKARLEERRGELVDPTIRATLRERLEAIAQQSLIVLQEKLSKPAASISDNLALRAAELGVKGLGLGNATPPAPPLDDSHLKGLASRLLELQKGVRTGAGNIVDAEVKTA